jgi:drug/metabolite transporter (DMT)-like permease
MSKKLNAHIAVLGANFFFGANFSIIKYITPSLIQPFALNVVRATVTTALLWILYLIKPSKTGINKKDIPLFLLCAATGVTINQLLFVKGLSLTTSIHGALLMLATPIFITIIAAVMFKEKLTGNKITGLILGVAGAAALIALKEATNHGTNILLGDIFVTINAIAYAFYLVLVKPLMEKYSALHVLRWVFTLGTIMIIPFGAQQLAETNFAAFETSHLAALFFIVIAGTFLAYLFNIYGVQHIGSSATGTYIYTQPVFATVIAMLFLNEPFTPVKAIAALLIFAGVFISTRRKKINLST